MKIAVAAQGKEKTSLIDSRFGRCDYFQVVDTDQDKIQVFKNPGSSARRGAGVTAGQFLSEQGIEVVVAGDFGPNAVNVLESAGIKYVEKSPQLTVDQVVKELKDAEK